MDLSGFRGGNEDQLVPWAAETPDDGVDVDLGLANGDGRPLTVKVRNGVPPFTFFANGAPFARTAFARQNNWKPDGPGYVTLSVVDAKGRSDLVRVFVE